MTVKGRQLCMHYRDEVFTVDFLPLRDLFKERNISIRDIELGKLKNIHLTPDVELESHARFGSSNWLCTMGSFSYTHSSLGFGVSVGRYCSIGSGLKIMGADHFPDFVSTSPRFYEVGFHDQDFAYSDMLRTPRNIRIGNDVWIGHGVTLSRDIRIGNGAIVATGAIVTKDVPDYHIVGGVPAKTIRPRFSDHLIERLQSLQWWKYHFSEFKGMDASKPEQWADSLERKISKGLDVYSPQKLTAQMIREIAASPRP